MALRGASDRFERRFRALEALAREQGVSLPELDAAALDAHWEQAKERTRSGTLSRREGEDGAHRKEEKPR